MTVCKGRVLDGTDMEDCNSPDVVRAGLCRRCLYKALEENSSAMEANRAEYRQLFVRFIEPIGATTQTSAKEADHRKRLEVSGSYGKEK